METWLPSALCALVESYFTYCQLYYYRTGDLGIVIHEPLEFGLDVVKPLFDTSLISHATYLRYCIHHDMEHETIKHWDDKYASQLLFSNALLNENWNIIDLFGNVNRQYDFDVGTTCDIKRMYEFDKRNVKAKIRYWQYFAIMWNRLDILQLTGPFTIDYVFGMETALRGANETTLDYILALCTSNDERNEIVKLAATYSTRFNWCKKHGFNDEKNIVYSLEYLADLKPGFVIDIKAFFEMNLEEALFFKQKFGMGESKELAFNFRNVRQLTFWDDIHRATFFVKECYLRPSQYLVHTDIWTNEELATVLDDPTHVLYESIAEIIWHVSTDKDALLWIMTHAKQLPRMSPFRKQEILLSLTENAVWYKKWQERLHE